jgi:hypothetical protein
MLSVASARRIENREDLHGKGTTIARVNVMMKQAAGRFKTVAAGSMRLQVGFQGGVDPFTEKFRRDVLRILAAARRSGTSDPQETHGTQQCTRKAVRAPCARALHDETADAELIRAGARLAPPSHPWWRSADDPSRRGRASASWQLDAVKHI